MSGRSDGLERGRDETERDWIERLGQELVRHGSLADAHLTEVAIIRSYLDKYSSFIYLLYKQESQGKRAADKLPRVIGFATSQAEALEICREEAQKRARNNPDHIEEGYQNYSVGHRTDRYWIEWVNFSWREIERWAEKAVPS